MLAHPVRSTRTRRIGRVLWALVAVLAGVVAFGPTGPGPAGAAVHDAAPGSGPAYWLFGSDGGVFPFGRGAFEGALAGRAANAPIVAGAVTPTGLGYWLVAADGGVFSFGDARFAGAMAGHGLPARVVAIAATPSGAGYWLASSDGGVYAFGDAPYAGGMSGKALSAPVVGMAATPTGRGYWLVGGDGGVYAFGDARYLGGASGTALNGAIVGVAATPSGAGYWLAGRDGGVYAFGDARFAGGLSGAEHAPITGISAAPDGTGYWLVARDGGVFNFGGAGYYGSVGASRLAGPVVGMTSGDGVAVPHAPSSPGSTQGYDISWPQCGQVHPAPPYGFGVVGVTGGHLFSVNPCLHDEWQWATAYGSFGAVYVNTNAPTADEYAAFAAARGLACGLNTGCVLDLWGRLGADQALRDASEIPAPFWWLDVETGNEWLPDPAANAVILRAMVDELQRAGKRVGIYSTSLQWGEIAAGYSPGLPTWVPGAPAGAAASYCAGQSFGGGETWLAQSGDGDFDTDVLCPAGLARYTQAFAAPAPLAVPRYAQAAGAAGPVGATAPATTPPATAVRTPVRLPPDATLAPALPAMTREAVAPIDVHHRRRSGLSPFVIAAALSLVAAGCGVAALARRTPEQLPW